MNEKTVTLFARYVRALLYSRPRYETKTKENPILHCQDQYHRKDTFTLHRHRERIALNGRTTRMEILRSAKARRLLVHRLTDSHCALVTWPRLTLKLIQSVALLPGAEIRDEPRSSNNREPCRWIRRTTGQKRREETRQGERGLRGVAALVGTRLGVGSFVSWTLLLARINLLPPPLASPHRPLAAVPSSAIPPFLGKRGV